MEYQWSEIKPNIWKPTAANEEIEGVYLGKTVDVGANLSNMYLIEKEGAHIKFWGCTVLDDRMNCVTPGEYIKVIYKGQEKNKKGQPVKIFDVVKRTEVEGKKA